MRPRLALVLVAIVAAGCASTAERDEALRASRTALEAKPACCKGSREFLFPRTGMPHETAFSIDRSSPVFAFPKGKSYFRGFELPAFERPYVVEIESRVMGGPDATRQWLFHPVVLFLDQDHRVYSVLPNLKFQPMLDGKFVSGMRTQLVLDERARRARYLVIYTEPDAMSRSFEFGTVSLSMAPGAPHNQSYSFPFGYEGRLILRIRPGVPAGPNPG